MLHHALACAIIKGSYPVCGKKRFVSPESNAPFDNASLPLGVFEDYRKLSLRKLFDLFGVPVFSTPRAWGAPLPLVPVMLIITFLLASRAYLIERILLTILWTALFELTSFIHSAGHILAGRAVNAPMDRLIVTSSRQVNVYDGDQSRYPARVHVTRALGGPLANIAVGLVMALLLLFGGYSSTFLVFMLLNFAFGFGALAPIRSVDGEVLMYYLTRQP